MMKHSRLPRAWPQRWPERGALCGWLLCSTLIGAGCAAKEQQNSTPAGSPVGVLLILVDALRADHVGAYGSTLGLTPHIDALAARGVVFANAVAPSSWTRSSVASLLTSRYPSAIGVLGRRDAVAPSNPTLPEALRSGGLETMWVVTNGNSGPRFGFAQGIDRWETPDIYDGYPDGHMIHTAEGVTRKALRFLDDRSANKPFFLFAHYVDPHDPYLPHPGLLSRPQPAGRFDGSRTRLGILDRTPPGELTEADYDRIKYLYEGEVKYCDFWIGELLRGLQERGLREDVLVVITADHGEELWERGARAHGGSLYQELVHVPLILDFPSSHGDLEPRIDQPVSLVDVAPTIVAAFGIAQPEEFRGADLRPLAAGEAQPSRSQYIYSEIDVDGRSFEAVRSGNLKLIRDRTRARGVQDLELYDLARDPAERSNLAQQLPLETARLERALDDIHRDLLAEATSSVRVDLAGLDRGSIENLRALGYLGGEGGRSPGSLSGRAIDLAAVLDFSQPDHAAEQLLRGFYPEREGRRWMAGQASVLLGRSRQETVWRLEGWIDLTWHGGNGLTITGRANGGESQPSLIEHSGFFTLEGSVPADSSSAVRLDLECDHQFVPASLGGHDERSLCAVVTSIRLR